MLIIRLGVSLLSIFGIFIFLHRCKLRVPADYVPAAFCGMLTVLLFFAALLNIFGPVSAFLRLFGCVYLIFCLVDILRRKWDPRTFLCPAVVFFTFAVLACLWFLRDSYIHNSDVYSHWVRVIKEVLSFDGFPTAESSLAGHYDYPPGAALFVGFLLRNVGYSDSLAIICHGILAAGLLSAFFIGISWKKPVFLLLRFALCFLCFGGFSSTVHDLMVDYVTALSGAAALILLMTACRSSDFSNHALLWCIPSLALPFLLKSAGIIYYPLGLLMLLFCRKRIDNLSLRQAVRKLSLRSWFLLSLPILIPLLWSRHTAHAWQCSDLGTAKFSFSVDNILSGLAEKTGEQLSFIVSDTLHNMLFSSVNRYFYGALLFICIVLILFKQARPSLTAVLVLGCSFWFIYQLGYLFMMCTLMPIREITELGALGGYHRYTGIFTMGLVFWWIHAALDTAETAFSREKPRLSQVGTFIAALTAVTSLLIPVWNDTLFTLPPTNIFPEDAAQMNLVAAQINGLYTRNDRLLLYSGDASPYESSYNNDVAASIFLTTNTLFFNNTTLESHDFTDRPGLLAHTMQQQDYVVVLCPHEDFAPTLISQGIGISDPDGTLYKVVTDLNNNIFLERVQ